MVCNPLLPNVNLNSIFRKRLQPLFFDKWVCDWAFENIDSSPFHNNNLQPIDVFSQLVLISVNAHDSRENGFSLSNVLENPCQCQIAFVPCHINQNVTVGYAICFDSIDPKKQDERWPFAPPFTARFILDHQTQIFTMIIPCFDQGCIAIHSADLNTNNHYTFIVPVHEYDWNTLPDHPLFVLESISSTITSHEIQNITVRNAESDQSQLRKNICIPESKISDLLKTINISSNHHTSFSNRTQLQSAITNYANNQSNKNSILSSDDPDILSYGSHPQLYGRFKNDIYNILCRKRFSIGKKIDTNPSNLPGYSNLSKAPHSHYVMRCQNESNSKKLSPSCLQIYYNGTLRLDIDNPLYSSILVFKSQSHAINHSSRTTTQEKFLLPKPEPVRQTNPSSQNHGKKHDKQTILAERRKRNRLSAARSNFKKQEQIEKKMRELNEYKLQIKQLEEVKKREVEKNEDLKKILNMNQNS